MYQQLKVIPLIYTAKGKIPLEACSLKVYFFKTTSGYAKSSVSTTVFSENLSLKYY